MLAIKFNGIYYPLEWRLPSAGDKHSLVMRDPASNKIIAALQWDAHTHVIGWIRVGNTEAEGKRLRRHGIATALLATARTEDPKIRHSDWRTDSGDLWARSLGERLPKRNTGQRD
jgi:hypothetical protein